MADFCENSAEQAWNLADYLGYEKIWLSFLEPTRGTKTKFWRRGSTEIEVKEGYYDYHKGYNVYLRTTVEPLTTDFIHKVIKRLSDQAFAKALKEDEAQLREEQRKRVQNRVEQIAKGSR